MVFWRGPFAVLTDSADPGALRCLFCPLFKALGGQPEDLGCRSLLDPIIADFMRLRGFPFGGEVRDFLESHEFCFVVEQNRDGQLRSLLVNELVIDPARLIPVLHYDGTPITARFIGSEIAEKLAMFNVTPLRKVAP